MTTLVAAATEVLRATDALRDARNGLGHPGEPHDRALCFGDEHGYHDPIEHCATCGGAEYGTDDALSRALGALRVALGMEPKPWETA